MSERVFYETVDKKYYIGKIQAFHSDIGKVEVEFFSGINADKEGTAVLLDVKEAEKHLYSIPTICDSDLSVGSCIWFVSGNLELQVGRVKSCNEDNTYNVVWYSVATDGRIQKHNDVVKLESITEISDNKNILPFGTGDKIEYEENKGEDVVKGKITYIHSDDTVDISFQSTRWLGSEDAYSVDISQIRVPFDARCKLDRSLFIDETRQKSIDSNEEIKRRIKEDDYFAEASGIAQSRKLYRHQRAGTILANKYDKFAFFYDTGTGKTVMALDIIAGKEKKDHAVFLIIAPKSIIKTAWIDDATTYYPNLRILPLYKGFDARKKRALLNSWKTGGRSSYLANDSIFYPHVKLFCDIYGLEDVQIDDDARVSRELEATAHHYIINAELFIRDPLHYIEKLGITGIVMDESAILKNYNGKHHK